MQGVHQDTVADPEGYVETQAALENIGLHPHFSLEENIWLRPYSDAVFEVRRAG